MRKLSIIFICLMFFLATASLPVKVNATGMELTPAEEEKIERVLSFRDFVFFTEEPKKQPMFTFDVNEDGYIALGHDGNDRQRISVFKDRIFQYGYSFRSNGTFSVEVNNDNVVVIFARGESAVMLSSDGRVSVLGDVVDSKANHDYNYELRESRKKVVGGKTYRIQTDPEFLYLLFSPNYTHLIVTETDGTRTVLYDATEAQWAGMGTTVIAFVAFGCLTMGFTFYYNYKKRKA